jgi:hypothetical protein
MELTAAAQRTGEQLCLHTIGIGDKDVDDVGSGGLRRAHLGSQKHLEETMRRL